MITAKQIEQRLRAKIEQRPWLDRDRNLIGSVVTYLVPVVLEIAREAERASNRTRIDMEEQ